MAMVMPPPFGSGPLSQPPTQLFGSGMGPPPSGSFGPATPPMPPMGSSFGGGNPFGSMNSMGPPRPPMSGGFPMPPPSMPFSGSGGSFGTLPPTANPGMPGSFATIPPTGFGMPPSGMQPVRLGFGAGTGSMDNPSGMGGHWGDDLDLTVTARGDNFGHLHTGFGHQDASFKDLLHQPLYVDEAPPPSDRPLHVGPYYSTFGAPLTPQYGIFDAHAVVTERQQEWNSKAKEYSSWGRAQLRNIVDVTTQTLAERMVNPWQWCFIHADGWLVNFWGCDPDTLTPVFDSNRKTRANTDVYPLANVDMRQIFAVSCRKDASSAEGALCPWEIHLNFQHGFLPIRVQSEKIAKEWEQRVMQAVVENTKIQQMREHDAAIMAGIEEFGEHNTKDLARMKRLKEIWFDAIECVTRGSKVRDEVFFRMHRLYDVRGGLQQQGEDTGDKQLGLHELSMLAHELIEVRTEEVKNAVVKEERLLHDAHRPVTSHSEEVIRAIVSEGKRLLEMYKQFSNPRHFMDRVVSFHSKSDISREGKIDVNEFMSAAPLFLLPEDQLRAEARFFHRLDHRQTHHNEHEKVQGQREEDE